MKYTRRNALAVAGAIAGTAALGPVNAQQMQERRALDVRTSLHRQQTYHVSAQRLYGVLLDSAAFAAFTHGPAHIDPVAGGAFSLFGGQIVGRNIELVPRTRIVQAWRSDRSWEPGVYSIVEFQLSGGEDETVLALRHTGFPEGTHDHLYAGWQAHYFDPLRAYLKHSQ